MASKTGTAQQDERQSTRGGYSNGLLDADTKKAMNAAFDSMSEWRDDMAAVAERHSAKVFDKMGAAAKAAGWPDALVETTRSNMQQMSKMQMEMMDQAMDAWTEQMKSPGKFTFGNAFANGLPGMTGQTGGNGGMMNPFAQFAQAFSQMPGFGQMPGMGQNFGQNMGHNFPMFPGMPQMDMSKFGFGTNPMAPFQFWMEATQLFQKQWADALSSMMNGMPGIPGQQQDGQPRKPTTVR